MKSFWECCKNTVLTILFLAVKSLYSCSEVCVSVSVTISQPFALGVGLDKDVCCYHSIFSMN